MARNIRLGDGFENSRYDYSGGESPSRALSRFRAIIISGIDRYAEEDARNGAEAKEKGNRKCIAPLFGLSSHRSEIKHGSNEVFAVLSRFFDSRDSCKTTRNSQDRGRKG